MDGVIYTKLADTRYLPSPLFRDNQQLPGHNARVFPPEAAYLQQPSSIDGWICPGFHAHPNFVVRFCGPMYGV